MAGIPLKSGADFYNLEASRMRLHNLGADPTEVGTGLIYFNTSTGMNTSGRARIYTGNGFKSLAFMEDIAAIQEQLDLLTGEVDTSELISNLEDVLNFLNNIKENDGDLMTMLDGKLDKTGGTITAADVYGLTINSNSDQSGIQLQSNGNLKGVLISGGTWGAAILNGNTFNGIGVLDDGTPYFKDFYGTSNTYTLLHSGNIGEYNAGGVKISAQPTTDNFVDYVASYGKGVSVIQSSAIIGKIGAYDTVLNIGRTAGRFGRFIFTAQSNCKLYFQTADDAMTGWSEKKTIAFTDSNVASAQALTHSNGTEGATVESNGRIQVGAFGIKEKENRWRLITSGLEGINNEALSDGVLLGSNNGVILKGNGANYLILNSSGNVTIGNGDLAGTDYKLYVRGLTAISASGTSVTLSTLPSYGLVLGGTDYTLAQYLQNNGAFAIQSYLKTSATALPLNLNPLGGNVLIGTATDDSSGAKLQVDGGNITIKNGKAKTYSYIRSDNYTANTARLIIGTCHGYSTEVDALAIYNGKVGIGTTSPTSKLHIVGDLYVEGNIVATKEVSAGGAAEESGEGGGGTGGGVEPYVFTFTPSTTTVSVNHNISSEDVIVQVYEKDATSGKWNVILVDIEIVDSTRVDLHFGRTETTEHKVVIIG